jgi:hypothetical protein
LRDVRAHRGLAGAGQAHEYDVPLHAPRSVSCCR